MPASNEYRGFGLGAGANVLSPADYLALPARSSGFNNGIADPTQCNTPWRQASVATAAIAQFVCDTTGVDMLDDGSINNFETKFIGALNLVVSNAVDASGSFGSGGIYGFIMSNTAGNPTTQITIQAGQCRNSLNNANITLAAPLNKRLDVAWAVGNNNGGRDAGALANGQTWHMFVILNPTTAVVDALFSQSPTAPTLPAGFTKFRRVGTVVLEVASTLIRQFLQTGDWFMLKVRGADFAVQGNGGGVPYLRSVPSAPAGIKTELRIYFQSNGTIDNNAYLSGIFDPDFGVPPAFGGPTQWAQVRRVAGQTPGGTQYAYGTVVLQQFSDSNKQVYTFSNDNSDVIAFGVLGWRDERGRFF